jgi:hypothetical protein
MVVRDEIKRLALVLEAHGRIHRAEVVADVEFSAGLETGQDAHGRSMDSIGGYGQAGLKQKSPVIIKWQPARENR